MNSTDDSHLLSCDLGQMTVNDCLRQDKMTVSVTVSGYEVGAYVQLVIDCCNKHISTILHINL